MFYSIPCIHNMIAAQQMDFVGKMIRGPPDRPSRNMITAYCDHKHHVGRLQMMGETSWLKTSASFVKTSSPFRLTDMAPCEAGFTKPSTKNIGVNWLSASFALPQRSQINPMIGVPFHPGKRVAPQLGANQPMTLPTAMTKHSKTTQKMTCTSPHNPLPPRPRPPPHHCTTHPLLKLQSMKLHTIQNDGSTTLPSAPWLVAVCSTH